MDYSCIDSNGVTGTLVYNAIEENKDGYLLQCIRLAAKRNLNAMLSSWRINGQSADTTIQVIVPTWEIALMVVNLLTLAGFVTFTVMSVVSYRKKETVKENE